MKPYVLQEKIRPGDPWEVIREFDTLEEARKVYEAMNFKAFYRIAEAYVQVRYKPVK